MSERLETVSTRLTRNQREMIAHVLQQLMKQRFEKEPWLTTHELARRCNVSGPLFNDVYYSGRLPHMQLEMLQGFIYGLGLARGRGGQPSHREVDALTLEDCISLVLRQSERQGTFWD